ncbi:MAG TPA: lasso peptide biosynthesis B2 protein [Candidatus Angelobacter sp.]|nr:lasso peptide biosynthesis B2 protein [Candidatus Angelobacter sp.]
MSVVAIHSTFRQSGTVREIATQDGAVLLDIQQGVCLGLNRLGSEIWSLLKINISLEQIADHLASKFGVSEKVVFEDCKQFLETLSQKQLAVSPEHTGISTRSYSSVLRHQFRKWAKMLCDLSGSRLLLWKAFCALLAFDLLGYSRNFAAMHRLVKEWSTKQGPADPNVIARVSLAINYACVWYPKRVLCLQRSAVTTCLLRSCGVPAQMVMGAQKAPFKAHAWTEVNGEAINENGKSPKRFLIWERC